MCFRTGRYSVLRPSPESWYTALEGRRDDVGAKSLVRAPLSPVRGDNYHNDRPVNVNNVPFSYRPPAVDWTHHIIIIIFFFLYKFRLEHRWSLTTIDLTRNAIRRGRVHVRPIWFRTTDQRFAFIEATAGWLCS